MNAGVRGVCAIEQMRGEDDEETSLLQGDLLEATDYIQSFEWCRGVRRVAFGAGIGGVVAVFFVEIESAPEVDRELWVVVGDLPSAYLVVDRASDPLSALEVYSELMDGWVCAVLHHGDMTRVFPVRANPSTENARALESRVRQLREEILPALREALP